MIIWLNSVSEQDIIRDVLKRQIDLLTPEELHWAVGVQISKYHHGKATLDVQIGSNFHSVKVVKMIRLELGDDGLWVRKESE
jgi:hypothetical protein